MDNGWIKIHRKIMEWEWYTDVNTYKLFTHFLLLANHETRKWKGETIKEGQFITGRHVLSKDTGLSEQQIRTCITRLKSTNEITTKSTNEFSLITIVKWADYQGKPEKSTSKSTSNLTNEQPAINHKQELKNDKKNTATEVALFNWDSYLEEMKLDKRLNIRLIALYFIKRRMVFDTKDEATEAIRRHLKDSVKVSKFQKEKIYKAIEVCENMKDVEWTLGTVLKVLTK